MEKMPSNPFEVHNNVMFCTCCGAEKTPTVSFTDLFESIVFLCAECMKQAHDTIVRPVLPPSGRVPEFLRTIELVCRMHGYVIVAQAGYDSTPPLEVRDFNEDDVRALLDASDCSRKE